MVDIGHDTRPGRPQPSAAATRPIASTGAGTPGPFIAEAQPAQEEGRGLEPVGEDEGVGGMPRAVDLHGFEAGLATERR